VEKSKGSLYAVKITPDDEILKVPYPKRTGFNKEDSMDELLFMQQEVDGQIKFVDGLKTGSRTAMIVNEDGDILGFPHNDIAQCFLTANDTYIVGNVLILSAVGTEVMGMTEEEAGNVILLASHEKERLGKIY
jgi:hypothetical protein